MRISQAEINHLILALTPFFKENEAELRLYGSRIHDHLKGGDFDLLLLVEPPAIAEALKLEKHHILANMKKMLGDRKIDLLIASHDDILSQTFLKLIYPESVILHSWTQNHERNMDAILKKPKQCIITCEHAVNTIPSAYQHLFHQQPDVLNSHRAIDFGARDIAKQFSQVLKCPLFEATTSRLLIECNRSLNHPKCFSEFTQGLTEEEKQVLIDQYYQPFHQAAETYIHDTIKKGIPIIHLSIHSFTPVLNNIQRNADIGFLYDPARRGEKTLAAHWREELLKEKAPYRVRMNYPYQGISNGFVSSLRKQYLEQDYLGFEVESNQALTRAPLTLEALSQSLTSSFGHVLRDER